MQPSIITLVAVVISITGTLAVPNPASLQKRGYGCTLIQHDQGICNFRCRNDIKIICGTNHTIAPISGQCGGPFGA
ncbi:MAG: hypothetical protein M1826_001022 [Phylliscum demangeonii]|nr:MAG: hypothetical protein M1826_001022 [Phylliscum demangeonii]